MTQERKTVDIIISDDLRNVLLEIQDSQVAQLLVKGSHFEDELADDYVNFISISKKDLTKISYLTKERYEGLSTDECWATTKRIMAKPGGFISKLFKDIPAKEVEKFSNLYRAQSNKAKFTFKVVEGDDIKTYYHINSYAQERGTLGASCMKYDNCQDYLGIYTENTDKVKLLVMLNEDGGLMGRALLWDFETVKIMDRIYTIADEEFLFQFKKWATDNGYLYKSEQNWYNTLFFENLSTEKKELKLDIKLNNFQFRRYPYVDTFKFLKHDTSSTNVEMPDFRVAHLAFRKDDWQSTCLQHRTRVAAFLAVNKGCLGQIYSRYGLVFCNSPAVQDHQNRLAFHTAKVRLFPEEQPTRSDFRWLGTRLKQASR
jgi:hypothetical protein